jgi:hypothetical protein
MAKQNLLKLQAISRSATLGCARIGEKGKRHGHLKRVAPQESVRDRTQNAQPAPTSGRSVWNNLPEAHPEKKHTKLKGFSP